MQINTNVLDLANITNDANVFAHNDSDNPHIAGAALQRHADQLLTITTDRFRFAISGAPADCDCTDEWETWIPYLDLKKLHAALKAFGTGKNRANLPVTIKDENGTVTVALPGQELSWATQPSELPAWRDLFARTTPADTTVQFNPCYLKDFGRVTPRGRKDQATVTVVGATTPTRIEIGDYFMGLLMPVTPDNTTTLFYPANERNQLDDDPSRPGRTGSCESCARHTNR